MLVEVPTSSDVQSQAESITPRELSIVSHPSTVFDNFYTPHNREFYARSPYQELNPKRREIRLLKVSPRKCAYIHHAAARPDWNWPEIAAASPNPVIACELVDKCQIARLAADKYIALSYCAGSPENTEQVLVNGLYFNVFANLAHAIECAIECWTSQALDIDKDLLLWVDQICINQSDPVERVSQVSMMQDIYGRSGIVYICLSTAANKWLGESQSFDFPLFSRPANYPWMMWVLGSRQDLKKSVSSLTAGHLEKFLLQNLSDEEFINKWVSSLDDFLTAPWWSRAWTYQEFIMAPRVKYLFKQGSITWVNLLPLLEYVCSIIHTRFDLWEKIIKEENLKFVKRTRTRSIHEQRIKEIRKRMKELNSQLSELQRAKTGRPRSIFNGIINIATRPVRTSVSERLISTIEELSSELKRLEHGPQEPLQSHKPIEPIGDKAKGLNQLRSGLQRLRDFQTTVLSVASHKSNRSCGEQPDLKDLLRHSRNSLASDDRDRVYAFLGLTQSNYRLTPNYDPSNTIEKVLIETAQAIIWHDNDLSILEHVTAGRDRLGSKLPTWVPDWTSRESNSMLEFRKRSYNCRTRWLSRNAFDTSRGTKTAAVFRSARGDESDHDSSHIELKVTGIYVGKLLEEIASTKDDSSELCMWSFDNIHAVTLKLAHHNDEIWVIHGAKCPVVLRRESQDAKSFSFLGEAVLLEQNSSCVSGIMFGQMINEVEQGKATAADIYIV
jgi:hypothetical protein